MVRLAEPPEHVLDAVRGVEEAVEEPLLEPPQLVEHHRLALAPGVVALVQEGGLADPPVDQAVVVLDHPRRVERPRRRRRAPREVGGLADREQGGRRVEVDRRGVELQLRLEADQVEPHDPADRLERPEP